MRSSDIEEAGLEVFKEWYEDQITDLRRKRHRFPKRIKYLTNELVAFMRPFHPLDVLTLVRLENTLNNPNDYVESEHEGNSLIVEHTALLLAKDAYRHGNRWVLPSDLSHINNTVKRILEIGDKIDSLRTRYHRRDEANPSLEIFQSRAIRHDKYVRNETFPIHQRSILRSLFEPLGDELRNAIGFGATDVIKIVDAIGELENQKLNNHFQTIRNENFDPVDSSREFCLKTSLESGFYKATKSEIREGFASGVLSDLSFTFFVYGVGDIMSHTIEEIADQAKVSEPVVQSYLCAASVEFGSIDSDFYTPTGRHPLRLRPILRAGELYCATAIGTLRDASRHIIERELKHDSALWNRYVKDRHKYLNDKSASLLADSMPGCEVETNLYYPVTQDEDNLKYEVDTIIKFGNVLIIIEAKAGGFKSHAREGKRLTLRRDLKKLIGEAHKQSERAETYISKTKTPIFQRDDGSSFVLDDSNITKTYLVSVTLESLGYMTAMINDASQRTVLGSSKFAWTVSLDDLMVVTDLLHLGPMIPHYIHRRLRVARHDNAWSLEELDLFMAYLNDGLYYDEDDLRIFDSLTDDLNSYYSYKYGYRTRPAEKPRQPIPNLLEELIHLLSTSNEPYGVDLSFILLDMNGDDREELSKRLFHVARKNRKTNRAKRIVLTYPSGDDPYMIALYVGRPDQISEAQVRKRSAELSLAHGIPKIYYAFFDFRGKKPDIHLGESLYNPFV
jgi:hypothetical protein